ncbi:MAG: clostripain-related cysteine peptidase [Bacteroides sp.]
MKIRLIALLLGLLSVMGGCQHEDEIPLPVAKTVFMYLVADNNLSDYLYKNIISVEEGLKSVTNAGTFVVYMDAPANSLYQQPTLFKYETDGRGRVSGPVILKAYDEQDSTNPEVMLKVFNDMKTACPSDGYGLVIGSHASGWLPAKKGRSRSFGDDDGSEIEIPVFVDVLSRTSLHFDYILMDACMMGSVEVACEFKNVADYLIFSPAEVIDAGFPYRDITKYLLAVGDIEQNVIETAKEYMNYYKTVAYYQFATISVLKTSELDALAATTKKIITAHAPELASFQVSGLQQYGRFGYLYAAYDFNDFIRTLTQNNIPNDFKVALERTIIYKDFIVSDKADIISIKADSYSGIGCYIPQSFNKKWNLYFKTLQWYAAAGWNNTTW